MRNANKLCDILCHPNLGNERKRNQKPIDFSKFQNLNIIKLNLRTTRMFTIKAICRAICFLHSS